MVGEGSSRRQSGPAPERFLFRTCSPEDYRTSSDTLRPHGPDRKGGAVLPAGPHHRALDNASGARALFAAGVVNPGISEANQIIAGAGAQ